MTVKAAPVRPDGVYEKAAATAKPTATTAATKKPTVVTVKAAPVRPDGVYEKKPDGMMRLIATERKTPEQEQVEKKKAEEAMKAKKGAVNEAKVVNDVKEQKQKQKQQQEEEPKPQQQQQPNNIKMTPINLDQEAKDLEKRLDSIEASMGREELEKNLQAEKLARGIQIPDLPGAKRVSSKPAQVKKSSKASGIFIDDIAAEIANEASVQGDP